MGQHIHSVKDKAAEKESRSPDSKCPRNSGQGPVTGVRRKGFWEGVKPDVALEGWRDVTSVSFKYISTSSIFTNQELPRKEGMFGPRYLRRKEMRNQSQL